MVTSPPDGTPNAGRSVVLTAGVVAFNEEGTVAAAVTSLLRQRLPPEVAWDRIWIVASGCTDGTVAEAERLRRADPRIGVLVEPERRGKAVALNEIFRRSAGEALVLLNADAVADPDAVAALLRAGEGLPAPFVVMASPTIRRPGGTLLARMLRLLWGLHHEFHLATLGSGSGNHVSDEMLLLSLPVGPELPEGLINDGSFFGLWMKLHGGTPRYAPDATVAIELPETFRDHLTQRRRILVGHAQVAGLLGAPVSTLSSFAVRQPGDAARIGLRVLRRDHPGWVPLLLLFVGEISSGVLSLWDRVPPRRDHVRWERIRRPELWAAPEPP